MSESAVKRGEVGKETAGFELSSDGAEAAEVGVQKESTEWSLVEIENGRLALRLARSGGAGAV